MYKIAHKKEQNYFFQGVIIVIGWKIAYLSRNSHFLLISDWQGKKTDKKWRNFMVSKDGLTGGLEASSRA